MAAVGEKLPEGRYGHSRTADERTDRKLMIAGSVLGVILLGVIGWFGYDYINGTKVSAEVIKFDVVSDHAVQAHLEVRKDAGCPGLLHPALAGRVRRRGGPRRLPLRPADRPCRQGRHAAYDREGDQCRAARLPLRLTQPDVYRLYRAHLR